MNIVLKSLSSNLPNDDRCLANIEVNYNNIIYNWAVFIPNNISNIDEYIESIENSIFQDIQQKEDLWMSMTEEEKIISTNDPLMNTQISYVLNKEDVVKPTIPDNYAIRKSLYPPLEEQLDAYWAGSGSSKYKEMFETIKNIKKNHPVKNSNQIPEFVSATQLRLWLIENNYNLNDIENLIETIEDEKLKIKIKTQWEYSPYIERHHPFVDSLGQMLGLDSDQIDAAFIEASEM
jgi:hypothetical protein